LAQPPPVSHRTKGGDPGVGYTWVRSMGLGKSPRVLWDQELGRPAQDSREITITPFWPPALDPDRVLHHNVRVAPSPKTLKSSQGRSNIQLNQLPISKLRQICSVLREQ